MIDARAYVFDAYGTLFDVHAAIGRHRAAAGPDADWFSEIWRSKQLEYTWTLTLAGCYIFQRNRHSCRGADNIAIPTRRGGPRRRS
jgi:FMN phosphatase YigB (HAD superfamily)